MLSHAKVQSLITEWGLEATAVAHPTTGTQNEIALVATASRRVVLRGHRRRDRGRIALEHEVMAFARGGGIPVPAVIPTLAGESIVERDGRFYSLCEHASGQQLPSTELAETLAAAMGVTLADLHLVLVSFDRTRAPRPNREHHAATTLRRVDELLRRIAALDRPGERESWAVERLQSQAAWLRAHPDSPDVANVEDQLVHGDFLHPNLFFSGGKVSAIIDWDKAELRPPAEEVVRTMDLSFRLDPGHCRAFLSGYRSHAPLSDEQLHQAATAYAHFQAHDLWVFESVYLEGDNRPARYLSPGPFVPFLDEWQKLAERL